MAQRRWHKDGGTKTVALSDRQPAEQHGIETFQDSCRCIGPSCPQRFGLELSANHLHDANIRNRFGLDEAALGCLSESFPRVWSVVASLPLGAESHVLLFIPGYVRVGARLEY